MEVASISEKETIERYNMMQKEYNALIESNILKKFFD
jgi:hypothetical protein